MQILAQTSYNNGLATVTYGSTITLDPTVLYSTMTMIGNISTYIVPNGTYAGQLFNLDVCQGAGGPYSVNTQPANVTGVTGPLNTTGCTRFVYKWNNTQWVVSIHGQNPLGFVPEYGADGLPLPTYSCSLLRGTTTVSGTFSITFVSNPLWTTPTSVYVRGIAVQSGTAGTPATSYTAYWTTVSNTSVSGFIKSGTTLGVLGATIVAGTVAEPITVEVCGW